MLSRRANRLPLQQEALTGDFRYTLHLSNSLTAQIVPEGWAAFANSGAAESWRSRRFL
jgi:hypothetical protein